MFSAIPLSVVRWMVIAIVVYAAITLIRAGLRSRDERESTASA